MAKRSDIVFNSQGIAHVKDQKHVSYRTAIRAIQRAVSDGRAVSLTRGICIDSQQWPSTSDYPDGILAAKAAHARARIECIAMAQAHPDRVLTGHAAALVHGLPLLDLPNTLSLSSPTKRASTRRTTTSGQQFHLNYAALSWPPEPTTSQAPGTTPNVTVIDGAHVTTIARTVVDIAAAQPQPTEDTRRHLHVFRRFAEALSLADASLRGNTGTLGVEGTLAGTSPMWPGAPARFNPPEWSTNRDHPNLAPQRHSPISSADFLSHLRDSRGALRGGRTIEILTAASPLSDSVFESATKALIIELRVSFVQQPRIVDESGLLVARVDFLLPQFGIIIECDGRIKYEPSTFDPSASEPTAADPWNDRRRDFRLTNLGYHVIHLTWAGLFDGSAAAAIRKAIRSTQAHYDYNAQPRGRWFDASTALPREAYLRFRDAA